MAPRPLGPTLNTNAIQDVDLDSLPDGIHALHQDKETVHDTCLSPAQAAKALDNKVEFKYIERYVNIEKPVATTQGTFFFVKNPNYVVATNIQGGSNNPKGAKVAMVMHDIKHDVWVTFKSKADTSRFIWRVANRSQAFDRYLADPTVMLCQVVLMLLTLQHTSN